jgi:hypothetical protein
MDIKKTPGCCGGACGSSGKTGDCCAPQKNKKIINIDFLYLDLSVCERCQGAESNLDAAINDVSSVLKAAGYKITVRKVNIVSKELAAKYEFMSSPTIRINGSDISMDVKESTCKECGDLCGDSVDCRVWIYDGNEYNEPPKEMIVNAILKEIYSSKSKEIIKKAPYILPHNLEVFFEGLDKNLSQWGKDD